MIPTARNAYMQNSVSTASPARLLVMLVDRLVLDVQRALDAQHVDDLPEAHRQLLHAQDIVVELRTSLRADAWEGGPALASLYDYLQTRLVTANVKRDAAATEHCLELVTGLAEAWREAAVQSAAVGA